MTTSDPQSSTILVVDDNEDHRMMITHALKRAGYSVFEAETGEMALDILREVPGRIDWLFTDIQLPGIDGWRVADEFRLSHPTRPVIYTSGHEADHARTVADSLFFEKPVVLSHLVKAFEDLSRHETSGSVTFRYARTPQ